MTTEELSLQAQAKKARYRMGEALSILNKMDSDELAHMEATAGIKAVIAWLRELEWCCAEDEAQTAN